MCVCVYLVSHNHDYLHIVLKQYSAYIIYSILVFATSDSDTCMLWTYYTCCIKNMYGLHNYNAKHKV